MPETKHQATRQTMSALQAAQLTESIKKEDRMLDMRYGKPSDAEVRTPNTGMINKMPSSTAPQIERPLDGSSSVGDPKQLFVDMSMSLWSSLNPGYMRQAPAKVCSVATADYAWDSEEVEYIRKHDRVGSRFHRRWDQQSRYNEAAALHRQVMKGVKEQTPGAFKGS